MVRSGAVLAHFLPICIGDFDLSLDFIRTIFETLYDCLFHGILLFLIEKDCLRSLDATGVIRPGNVGSSPLFSGKSGGLFWTKCLDVGEHILDVLL